MNIGSVKGRFGLIGGEPVTQPDAQLLCTFHSL
jgi:hypothetical protein